MSRLEEIKNEYLRSLGYRNYDHLVADIKSERSPIEKLILLEDDISEIYAREVAKASLEKASLKADYGIYQNDDEYLSEGNIFIDRDSITNEDNIVML